MATSPNMPVDTAAVAWNDGTTDHVRVYSSDGYNVTEGLFTFVALDEHHRPRPVKRDAA